MKLRTKLLMMAFFPCMLHAPGADAQTARDLSGRIAFSTDGNIAGKNDIASIPLSIALLDKVGQTKKIVYVDYANRYWNKLFPVEYNAYKSTMEKTFVRFDLDKDKLYDVSKAKEEATLALVKEINKSTVTNPLRVILTGPAEHLCDAVKRSDKKARQNVLVYTYADKDNNMRSGPGACNMDELSKLKPTTVKFVNYPVSSFKLKGEYSEVAWLKNSKDDAINWIYKRLAEINPKEASLFDAGITWALLMNDTAPTLWKLGNFFKANELVTPDIAQPTPGTPTKDIRTLKKVLADSCYQRVWNPREADMGVGKWSAQRRTGSTNDPSFDQRASYVEKGPDGLPSVQFIAYHDKNNALLDFRRINAAPSMPKKGMEEARFMVSYYLPSSYQFFASGRLAAGMYITDPNNPGTCMGGGCPPEQQTGSSVRINFDRDETINSIRPMVYSYHLNRTSPVISWIAPAGDGKTKLTRKFGQGPTVSEPMPKNEWFTMILDVKLNDAGVANGSARLLVYNELGKLVTAASLDKAMYRTNPNWKIMGPYLTEKYNNDLGPGPKTQSMYARNYGIFNKVANCE